MSNCKICNAKTGEKQKFCVECGCRLPLDSEAAAQIDILGKMLASNPLDAETYKKLGDVYLENNALDHAEEQFLKAKVIDDTDVSVYFKLAECKSEMDEFEEASEYAEKIAAMAKDDPDLMKRAADIFCRTGSYDKAISLATSCLEKQGQDDLGLSLLIAESHLKMDRNLEALEVLKNVKEDYKKAPLYLEQLGVVYEKIGKFDDCEKIREKIWSFGKTGSNGIDFLKACLLTGKVEKALDIVKSQKLEIPEGRRNEFDFYAATTRLLNGELRASSSLFSKIDWEDRRLKFPERQMCIFADCILTVIEKAKREGRCEECLDILPVWSALIKNEKRIEQEYATVHALIGEKYKAASNLEESLEHYRTSMEYGNRDARRAIAEIYAIRGEDSLEENDLEGALGWFARASEKSGDGKDYRAKIKEVQSLMASRKRTKVFKAAAIAILLIGAAAAAWFMAHGHLSVVAGPDGAKISVFSVEKKGEGTVVGNATSGKVDLRWLGFGEYRVFVEKKGYEDYSENVNVGLGRTTNLDVSLVPEYGSLSVKTQPEGASVFIDGQFLGFTPIELDEVMAASHGFKIKKENYLLEKSTILVRKGETTEIDIRLDPLKTYGQSEILGLFAQDYKNNQNLAFSYNVLLDYVNRVEEEDLVSEIAGFVGACYNEKAVAEGGVFYNVKFVDEETFVYRAKDSSDKGSWKLFKVALPDFSASEILEDSGSLHFLNRNEAVVYGKSNLYRFDFRKNERSNLGFKIHQSAQKFALSPNSRLIAYSTYIDGSYQLYLFDTVDYSNKRIAGGKKGEKTNYICPFFSRDGQSLYFVENKSGREKRDMLKYDLASKKKKVFFSAERLSWQDHVPGEKNIYSCYYDKEYGSKIVVLDQKRNVVKKLSPEDCDDKSIVLCEKAGSLFFSRETNGHRAVWKHDLGDESLCIPLIPVEHAWVSFDVSPDGKKLIYVSDHSGEQAVYFVDMAKEVEKDWLQACRNKLRQLMDLEDAKGVVGDFISKGFAEKRYFDAKAYVSEHSRLAQHLTIERKWKNFLGEIGRWDRRNLILDSRELKVKRLYGGAKDGIAKIKANVIGDMGKKGGSYFDRFDFGLEKTSRGWKIVSIENKD